MKKSKADKYILKKSKNQWKTNCSLSINHYYIGNGYNHIVFLGAVHGAEIITSEFLLYVMDEIVKNEIKFKEILDNYTLDFIPIVNPEGYVITTSIVRKYISRSANILEIQDKCNNYQIAYKKDDIEEKNRKNKGLEPDHNKIKKYQKMFENYTWNDIPDKYTKIKEHLKLLYDKYQIPNGAIIEWSANADGIDLNANIKYNVNLHNIEQGKILYMPYRNSNIKYSNPGPINCPYNKENDFKVEKENIYVNSFLKELDDKNKLKAIFNYHSAGAMIYQRPSKLPQNFKCNNINLKLKTIENYFLAKKYQSETYIDDKNKLQTQYKIIKQEEKLATVNDYYRIVYPMDLLIELSPIIGNPFGPYSSIINYKNTMKSNFNAIYKSIINLERISKISNQIYKQIEDAKYENNETFVKNIYKFIDENYDKLGSELE